MTSLYYIYIGDQNTIEIYNIFTVIKPDILRECGNVDELLISKSDVEFTEVLGEGKLSNHWSKIKYIFAWFLRIASVRECLYTCVFACVCVCPPPRLLITSGVMWCIWLVK